MAMERAASARHTNVCMQLIHFQILFFVFFQKNMIK
jgi:hypothetical protein